MICFRAQETWARLLTQPRVSWCARRVSLVLISQRTALSRGLSEVDLRLVDLFRRTLVFSDTQKKFVRCRFGAVGGNVGVGSVLHSLSEHHSNS